MFEKSSLKVKTLFPYAGFCIKVVTQKRNKWSLGRLSTATSCSPLWLSSEAWKCSALISAHLRHRSHMIPGCRPGNRRVHFHWYKTINIKERADGILLCVHENIGGCTEAAEPGRLHWGRYDACWTGWCHQEAVERPRRAGRLRESRRVPAERLCWLVSPSDYYGDSYHTTGVSHSIRVEGQHLLINMLKMTTITKVLKQRLWGEIIK